MCVNLSKKTLELEQHWFLDALPQKNHLIPQTKVLGRGLETRLDWNILAECINTWLLVIYFVNVISSPVDLT